MTLRRRMEQAAAGVSFHKIRRWANMASDLLDSVNHIIPTKADTSLGVVLKVLAAPSRIERWYGELKKDVFLNPNEHGFVLTRHPVLAQALLTTRLRESFTWTIFQVSTDAKILLGEHISSGLRVMISAENSDDTWIAEEKIAHDPLISLDELLYQIWPAYNHRINIRSKKHSNQVYLEPHEPPQTLVDEDLLKEIDAEARPGRVLLLHGPPGTGKSSLSVHLASRRATSLLRTTGIDCHELPRLCKSLVPGVLVCEDIDRQAEDSVAELLDLLEHAYQWASKTSVILTANRPEVLPFAALRPSRIDYVIEVGAPTRDKRVEILHRYGLHDVSDAVLDATEGWTGAFLKEFASSCIRHGSSERALHVLGQLMKLQEHSRHLEETSGTVQAKPMLSGKMARKYKRQKQKRPL